MVSSAYLRRPVLTFASACLAAWSSRLLRCFGVELPNLVSLLFFSFPFFHSRFGVFATLPSSFEEVIPTRGQATVPNGRSESYFSAPSAPNCGNYGSFSIPIPATVSRKGEDVRRRGK